MSPLVGVTKKHYNSISIHPITFFIISQSRYFGLHFKHQHAIFRFHNADRWHDDVDDYERRTPTDSSGSNSRVNSPDALLDVISAKLKNGTYDRDYDFSSLHEVR